MGSSGLGATYEKKMRRLQLLKDFTSRQDCSTRLECSAGFTGSFPWQLPTQRIPAFFSLCRHLPDLVRRGELVSVPQGCRGSLDRGRSFLQSILLERPVQHAHL